jgi:hypothetical protein
MALERVSIRHIHADPLENCTKSNMLGSKTQGFAARLAATAAVESGFSVEQASNV